MTYGFGSMMGFGIFGVLFSLVISDLVLVGVWLWTQIQKG